MKVDRSHSGSSHSGLRLWHGQVRHGFSHVVSFSCQWMLELCLIPNVPLSSRLPRELNLRTWTFSRQQIWPLSEGTSSEQDDTLVPVVEAGLEACLPGFIIKATAAIQASVQDVARSRHDRTFETLDRQIEEHEKDVQDRLPSQDVRVETLESSARVLTRVTGQSRRGRNWSTDSWTRHPSSAHGRRGSNRISARNLRNPRERNQTFHVTTDRGWSAELNIVHHAIRGASGPGARCAAQFKSSLRSASGHWKRLGPGNVKVSVFLDTDKNNRMVTAGSAFKNLRKAAEQSEPHGCFSRGENWEIEGQKRRITRKGYRRLWNEFETRKGQGMLPEREKMLEDRGALPKKIPSIEGTQCYARRNISQQLAARGCGRRKS